jgi:hypothetical protein
MLFGIGRLLKCYWTAPIVLPLRRLVKHFMPRSPREKADRMGSKVPLWSTLRIRPLPADFPAAYEVHHLYAHHDFAVLVQNFAERLNDATVGFAV